MFEIKIDGAGGSGEDRPPWKYSIQLQEVFRKACEQRMQLLPYIYSCANTSYRNGVMMKPLAYAYPEDNRTVSIWDEFIFGNAFLVAPIFEQQNQRKIYLPAGDWYDFKNPIKSFAGAQNIRLDVPLNEIPVFIKANSIYVTGDIFRGNSRIWQGELNKNGKLDIHAYPGSANSQSNFAYVDYTDYDKEKKMVLTKEGSQITFTSEPLSINSTIAVRCPGVPKIVLLNSKETAFDFDAKNAVIKIQASANQSIQLKLFF
jgi:alpha-glucosidase (family GH31 glycosyl hydrolase)